VSTQSFNNEDSSTSNNRKSIDFSRNSFSVYQKTEREVVSDEQLAEIVKKEEYNDKLEGKEHKKAPEEDL